jgi:tetratricopeptide (TPR) repeat protein
MSQTNPKLSPEDDDLLKEITTLINQREYEPAKKKILNRLEQTDWEKTKSNSYLLGELGGSLIDICEEGKVETAGHEGLKILKELNEDWPKHFWPPMYEYNLGNAYESLFKCKQANGETDFKPDNISLLKKAKDHYWRAYKLNNSDDKHPPQPNLLVNLGNSLSRNGRIAEAFRFLDFALKVSPDFPMAHANRSEALLWLSQLSGTHSMNLIYQAMDGYNKAASSDKVPRWMTEEFNKRASYLESILKEQGYTQEDFKEEKEATKNEKEEHSDYRLFCLNNHLALSEHSLYCHCAGARRDDLMIPTPGASIIGEFVPKMEHILNRVKSEFSLARLLFYQSLEAQKNEWEVYQDEVVFTELHDNEAIGIKPEMLRTSFRLCYGILDKIAEGVCELYDLTGKKENVSFPNFWRSKWEEINAIDNISLTALYSQAHDLNDDYGEWNMFKDWRNSLEHEILVLTQNDPQIHDDPFNIYDEKRGIVKVGLQDFLNKTLHLLQFTRSAIFNFTFLVRNEGRKGENPGDLGLPITFRHK